MMAKWDLNTRARELADRERRLYDQRELPAVLEELAAENEALRAEAARLRAEAEKSAAQRDEAVLRATQAEERLRAVEADNAELQAIFDLQWEADMRALKEWRDKNPGNDLVWPHSVRLTAWALAERDIAVARMTAAEAELARIRSDRQKGEAL